MNAPESSDRESAQALVHEMRAGNVDAAYELLGKQTQVRAWREALEQIARSPEQADIELAAHRSLRRPPQVVAALLDLAGAVRTAKAGHVAHAASRLRDEAELVQRATEVRDEIRTSHDIETALASDDGIGSLYLLLSQPLRDQRETMSALADDPDSRALIVAALDAEYQRLLELGRAVRWTSGSYRYFLRHALADLALIADTGGRTGQLAFRLLQQQVERPAENEEVLGVMPSSTRRRFLSWALERENAVQHTARTRFVLRKAREYPSDVERRDVVGVLGVVDDSETQAEALLTAVSLAPDVADIDRQISEWVCKADVVGARSLISALVGIAPSRLRPDLLTAEMRALVAEGAGEVSPDVANAALSIVRDARDSDSVLAAIDLLDRLDRVDTDVYSEAAGVLMHRVDDDSRWTSTFESALGSDGVVRGGWAALPWVPEPGRTDHLRTLLAASTAEQAGRGTAQLLATAPETTDAQCSILLDAVAAGALEPEELRSAPTTSLQELSAGARVRSEAIERDIASVRQALDIDQEDVEHEMREKLRPIVERAMERAHGNDRLAGDYQRLLPSDRISVNSETDPAGSAIPAAERAELARIGASITEGEGHVEIEFVEGSAEAGRVRYLVVLDKRSRAGSPHGWAGVLDAYVSAMGRSGDAGLLVAELFERGPRMKLVLGLSSDTRRQLLVAATSNGLDVPRAWREHDTLGEWLRSVLEPTRIGSENHTRDDPIDLLKETRRRARELEVLREQTMRLEHEAKLAFVTECRAAFEDLELTIDGYVQLWRALAGLGVAQVEPLGAIVERGALDAKRHQIVGEADADRFVVRAAGITVDDEIVAPARVERTEG